VGGREQRNVYELERGRGDDVLPGRALDAPRHSRERREHGDEHDHGDRGRGLRVARAAEQKVPDRVQNRRREREPERCEAHQLDPPDPDCFTRGERRPRPGYDRASFRGDGRLARTARRARAAVARVRSADRRGVQPRHDARTRTGSARRRRRCAARRSRDLVGVARRSRRRRAAGRFRPVHPPAAGQLAHRGWHLLSLAEATRTRRWIRDAYGAPAVERLFPQSWIPLLTTDGAGELCADTAAAGAAPLQIHDEGYLGGGPPHFASLAEFVAMSIEAFDRGLVGGAPDGRLPWIDDRALQTDLRRLIMW